MPGPNSRPNGVKRDTPQWIPKKLAARIAAWELAGGNNQKSKTVQHKPGSQK